MDSRADALAAQSTALLGRCELLLGKRIMLERQLARAQEQADADSLQAEATARAAVLLQALGERQRERLRELLEPLCTAALQDIYGDDSSFALRFRSTESGRHRADMVTSAGNFTGRPQGTDGGSVTEILSIVLRLSVLMMYYPRLSPVLVLDEPLSALDDDRVPALAAFIQDTAAKLRERGIDLQLIVTAHRLLGPLEPYADNILRVTHDGLQSTVRGQAGSLLAEL